MEVAAHRREALRAQLLVDAEEVDLATQLYTVVSRNDQASIKKKTLQSLQVVRRYT